MSPRLRSRWTWLDFAVIGAGSRATRTAGELLHGHPQVSLASAERPLLLGLDKTSVELRPRKRSSVDQRVRGALAPDCMRGCCATTTATIAARMARMRPHLKLIALLPDPIELARSEHRIAQAQGRERRRFEEMTRQLLTPEGLSEGRFLPDQLNTFLTQGEYGRILGEYLRHFPSELVHVELLAEVRREPDAARQRVLEFLGVGQESRSVGDWAAPCRALPGPAEAIAEELRLVLAAHYAADAHALRVVAGIGAPWARPPRGRRPIVVYTVAAGGMDGPEEPGRVSAACDYVCFTDNPYLRSAAWQLRPLELLDGRAALRAGRPKAFPRRYLPEYDTWVWLEPGLTLRGDPAAVARPGHRVIVDGTADRALLPRRVPASGRRAAVIRAEIERASTVVLSFPKAGRSWLCYFLARYVSERTGNPLDLDLLAPGRAIPPVAFLHEHVDVFEHVPAPARLLNQDLLIRRRLVVLVRDPRDSLLSYWHHRRFRDGLAVPSRLELFAFCPVYGIERISYGTALLLDLYDSHPGDRLLLRYEHLARAPDRGLVRLLRFVLDGADPEGHACAAALAASRFERMREWERRLSPQEAHSRYDGRFGSRRTGSAQDGHFKVRRGKVGAFRTEMSPQLQLRLAALPGTAALLERLARSYSCEW